MEDKELKRITAKLRQIEKMLTRLWNFPPTIR